MSYIVWDTEITDVIGDDKGRLSRPWELHLSVACTIDQDGTRRHFLGSDRGAVSEMLKLFKTYDFVVGFNSVNFDNKVIDGALGMFPGTTNQWLAGKQVDILQHIIQSKIGHRLKLQQLAEGIGKSKSGDGAEAPKLWNAGKHQEVIDYCYQDVEITKAVYKVGTEMYRMPYKESGNLHWVQVLKWVVI